MPRTPVQGVRVVATGYRDTVEEWRKRFNFSGKSITVGPKDEAGDSPFSQLLERSKRQLVDLTLFPDSFRGWRALALKTAKEQLEEVDHAAIISSSGPITSHLVARDLKQSLHLPWVADLRDLWSQNGLLEHTMMRTAMDRCLEARTLKDADAIVTVTNEWARMLEELHLRKPVVCIPNGYDPSLVNPGTTAHDKFTISYTGHIYRGKQDPHQFLMAIRNLIDRGEIDVNQLRIQIIGRDNAWLNRQIADLNLGGIVALRDSISRQNVIIEQWRSHLLLILTWDSPYGRGHLPAKIFEYIAARVPVLAVGPRQSAVASLVEELHLGSVASSVNDIETLVLKAYHRYEQEQSALYDIPQALIDQYSQTRMAKRFSDILESVAGLE